VSLSLLSKADFFVRYCLPQACATGMMVWARHRRYKLTILINGSIKEQDIFWGCYPVFIHCTNDCKLQPISAIIIRKSKHFCLQRM